jgi:hypothetical protein
MSENKDQIINELLTNIEKLRGRIYVLENSRVISEVNEKKEWLSLNILMSKKEIEEALPHTITSLVEVQINEIRNELINFICKVKRW